MLFVLPNIGNTKLKITFYLEGNLVEEKPNSSILLSTPTSNSLPELVNTVERYASSLNKYQIFTAVNDIQPRAHTCIESDGGAFEYKLKSFEKN